MCVYVNRTREGTQKRHCSSFMCIYTKTYFGKYFFLHISFYGSSYLLSCIIGYCMFHADIIIGPKEEYHKEKHRSCIIR
jgi:hypothetical protein